MNKVLEQIAEIVQRYHAMKPPLNGGELNVMYKDLTAKLYYLETERAEYHKQYESVVHKCVSDGLSVARSTNEANVQVPELYLLRRVMDAGYRVSDAMRTNISYIKSEMNNIN